MKKSLIALAAVAAVSAASAQSSVTVYGVIDAGITRDTGGLNPAASSVTRLDNGIASGSRLGFRGTEDLGGGLKANFVAETGFCADSNAGAPNFCSGGNNFMGREARVGLSGGFGSLDLGRQYTPAFVVLTTVDPFGTGTAGQVTNLMDSAGGFAAAGANSGNPRMNNTVKYTTANFGGFSASGAYGFGEVAGNNSAGRNVGFNATYANGPLYVGLAYHAAKGGVPVFPAVQDERKNVLIGATYNFGVATAHAMYGTTKNEVAQGLVAANTAGSINNGDGRNLMVGVSVPFGSGKFVASYINHDDKGRNNFDANQFGLGYLYSLSKRTTVYTAYSKISSKNGAFYTVGNAANNGLGNAAFNLGVRHTF
jgi:predicted porin